MAQIRGGGSAEDAEEIKLRINRLPGWLRLWIMNHLDQFCPRCGRMARAEAKALGVTAYVCDGGKHREHPSLGWEAEHRSIVKCLTPPTRMS